MLLVSYNIQYGKGKDGRFDLARICAALDGADIIALQEVERHWPRSGMADQPAEIARLLGHRHHWVYGPGFDVAADDAAPGNRRRQFGNMLLSRWPILSSRHHMLPKMGLTRQFSLQRSAIEAVVEPPGLPALRVYSLHLSHVGDGDRAPQVERLLQIHRDAPLEGGAWCGGHAETVRLVERVAVLILLAVLLLGIVRVLEPFAMAIAFGAFIAIGTWPARDALVRAGLRPGYAATMLLVVLVLAVVMPLLSMYTMPSPLASVSAHNWLLMAALVAAPMAPTRRPKDSSLRPMFSARAPKSSSLRR